MLATLPTLTTSKKVEDINDMAFNISQFQQHLQKAIDDLPQSIIYNSNTYSVIADVDQNSYDRELAGVWDIREVRFVCNTSSFVTTPSDGEFVTYQNKEYTIERIDSSPDEVSFTIVATIKK